MDYSFVALIALLAATAVLSTRHHRRTWSNRSGHQYQRVFSLGAFGLWLTVAGAIGWDVRHVHGFFQGTKWGNSPIWWQLAFGVALLAVAVFLARRVPYPPRPHSRT